MSNIDKNYEDFLKSLQEDNNGAQESFPFSEDFDIENFIKTTETQAAPVQTIPQEQKQEYTEPTTTQINTIAGDNPQLDTETQQTPFDTNEDKNYSIKRLEEKLSDLQQRFNKANADKEEESAFAEELNKQDEEPVTEPVKSDEEFFSNISSAIQTLKGSLDNIVSTRLRYEENLIRQDQTLITRLREKTTRLKAINLALNSEVKRAKNEKLEYLRKTAEQTKELLSLRMQLSHVEERTKQGDFKISNLEQQISLLTQEKSLLDEEISKIRQEKLDYLKNSAEQTRDIMQLRHQLAAKEEALKQEEVKTNFLDQQLKAVEAAHQALKQGNINSNTQERTLLLQKEEINSLNAQLNQSRSELAQKTQEATTLRQQLLNLQLSPEQNKSEMAAFAVKQEELMAPLKLSQQEHERQIALLKAEQSAELQRLRTKALQEETALRNELQSAEIKYHQEESFVNSLKTQIKTLEDNLQTLEREKANYQGKSENLTKELDSIRDNNQAELENLKDSLKRAQNSYERQQDLYNNLETQYQNIQREKYYLGEELKKTISQKDNALLQNERYLNEIEKLKNNQNDLTNELKAEIQNLLASKNQLTQELAALKQNPTANIAQLQQTQGSLQEKNLTLEALKEQMLALITSKSNTDKALFEAREEKLNLLNKLEEQTRQLNVFQTNYQNEIAALTKEKVQAQLEAESKIKNLEEKIKADQVSISAFKAQIKNIQNELVNHQNGNELPTENLLKNKQLTKDLEKAKKVFEQDTILLEELKHQYTQIQERNNTLETELAKANEESKQIEQERQAYKQQIEDLNKQLESVKAELKQGQEFTKQLSAQITKLKTVNTALSAALTQMQNQKIEALNTTAKQTQEILELKEQLKKLQTDSKALNFGQGTVTVSAEHEAKIKSLEEELKRVSGICATQTKELNDIKTDNLHLKNVAEEKLLLQNRFNALQRNVHLLTEELNAYKGGADGNALIKAKTAALTVQLERVSREKDELQNQLEATRAELQAATERERKTTQELETLRKNLAQNEINISKIKEEITPLTKEVVYNKKASIMPKIQEEPAAVTLAQDSVNINTESIKMETMQEQNNQMPSLENFEQEDAAITQRDILADYDTDEKEAQAKEQNTLSFLENDAPMKTIEEIDLPGPQINLESIFDDDKENNTPQELTQEDMKVVVENIRPTDINKIANISKVADAKNGKEKIAQELKISEAENTYTDHSIRRSVVNRRPYAKNPLTTFQTNEEYSDFLKKTKSLFYRIKWSLFKD